ncbi:polysaccharide deacetylase family protein [Streptomyces sp. NPDC006512]|uniref:polysaccharide deacetylase family protein n=1 Tax=Streptomyces sp. NPDC006512 TaxID=3154307 RepID=UPI0033A18B3D
MTVDARRRAVMAGLGAVALAAVGQGTGRAAPSAGLAPGAPRAAAGPRPPEAWMGTVIRRIPTTRRIMALTFNAAWDESGLDTVLTELRRRKLAATFFPTGQFAEQHPGAVRAMAAAHGLGNHSHTHPYFKDLSTTERHREVRRADAAIREAAGTEPLPLFRFPYSSTTADSVADVNDLGYAVVEYTQDTNGYLGPQGGMSVDKAVRRAVDAFKPGAVLQMHVGSTGDGIVLDAEALPRIIDAALAEDYEITDLRHLLVPATPARAFTPHTRFTS